jgi:hypothetical protein
MPPFIKRYHIRGRIQRKTWCMRPYIYAGDDYNLTLCPFQSRLQHIYHGQPYARVDLNPMPESTLSPVTDFGFGPRTGFCSFKSSNPRNAVTTSIICHPYRGSSLQKDFMLGMCRGCFLEKFALPPSSESPLKYYCFLVFQFTIVQQFR